MSTESTDLDINRYSMISKIGEGNFSQVYRVKDNKTNEYYAAKVFKLMIDEDIQDPEEMKLLFREVNLMSSFNHPSILKFVGYYSTNFEDDPVPTLITEIASNGSLRYLIELENCGLSPSKWNGTKKLITIYGIAAGMSYLHQHNVLHRDLKPENILIDDYLHPKISDFGLSKLTDFLSVSMNFPSQKGLKGTPAYMAPEILRNEKYSKAGDVYAFGLIVFELISGKVPYENMNFFTLIKKVADGYRPPIDDDVPDSYRELIELCWSQDPDDRPSFNKITSYIKKNKDFFTEEIDESEFFDFADFIDNYRSTFDISKRVIHFSEFIENQGRNKTIQKFILSKTNNKEYEEITLDLSTRQLHKETTLIVNSREVHEDITDIKYPHETDEDITIIKDQKKIDENEEEEKFIFEKYVFEKLTKSCQTLVEESRTDPAKQFFIGKSLIDGTNEFPKNINIGIKFIEESVKNNFIEAMIYYSELLIKGYFIQRDLQKSSEYLSKIDTKRDAHLILLKGKISYKQKKYKESIKYFEEGAKMGDKECMYEYGKMYFLGEGIEKNDKECIKYIRKSKDLGYQKAFYFLQTYYILKQSKEFDSFSSEIKLIFINNNIKNKINNKSNEFDQLILKPQTTEKLFFSKTLASQNFIEYLREYKKITIEIEYPSSSFEKIVELATKIRSRMIKYIEIVIAFSSFPKPISRLCFSDNISYCTIDKSVHSIPCEAFKKCALLKQIHIPSSVTEIDSQAFKRCSSLTKVSFEVPSSITVIDFEVFTKCSSLTQISIPSSVTVIQCDAFRGCSRLTQISIPSSVTSILLNVFVNCSKLAQISFPSSITSIPSFCFINCSSLTQIKIHSSVTSIGWMAFAECSSLTHVSFEKPSSITFIGDGAFKQCTKLKQISIPSTVTKIGDITFFGCSSLSQITFDSPSSLTDIGNETFKGCSSLRQIFTPTSLIEQNLIYSITLYNKKAKIIEI